jgi:predicted peptidase
MNNRHIKNITAVTEVFPDGQKCIAAVLEYDVILAAQSVSADAFSVEARTIVEAAVSATPDGERGDGSFVTIRLSADDKNAKTFAPGNPWSGEGAKVQAPRLSVSQGKALKTAGGEEIPPAGADENTAVKNRLVEEFVQGSFEGLAYNLFIPRNYDANKSYPLVQFIHDAAVCGDQPECTLAQGVGALVWMTEEAQAKHECFVLAPQYAGASIVDDDWNVDHRLEVGKRLLDKIVSEYSIDTDRLYTTGQSMGCMSSMVLNLRYPDLFAASYLVAGQWDERQFEGAGLWNKHFWMINSQGDAKAFPGMNQILCVLEKEGAQIAREVWDAKGSQEEHENSAKKLIATGANIIYTPYEITSIADGWSSHGGEHHITTWQYAYNEEAARDWLFDQKKGE